MLIARKKIGFNKLLTAINMEFDKLLQVNPSLKHINDPECFNIARGIVYSKFPQKEIIEIEYKDYIAWCDSPSCDSKIMSK